MALRIVCKKCGYINKTDSSFCAHCKEDISCDRVVVNVGRTETHCFYDYVRKTFCDETPFQTQISETPEEEDRSEDKESLDGDNSSIKICPMCGTANDLKNEYCTQCNSSLRLARPTVKDDHKCADSVSVSNENSDSYSLVFGCNGENIVKIVFVDNRFLIGRDYQAFLENEYTVSRKHCYIKKLDDGSFALFESKASPSTNHTYVRLSGGRLDRVVPGIAYPLSDGTIFVLANKVPVLFKKEIC